MTKRLLLIILLPAMLLSGCWDVKEPERMLYINGVGVDYKDDHYILYAQIINFANTAKSEQPTTAEVQAEVGHATGRTLDEAIFNLYRTTDQTVFWGHMSYLVVSEEAMQNVKLSPVIDLFIRYRETRYQIWVYTTEDPVEEILLLRPVINKAIILSKLGDPENSFEQESFVSPLDIRRLIIQMNEPSHEAKIPLISIKENWSSLQEKIKAPELAGVGIATPNGFKGFLKGDKAKGIQWMSNDTKRGEVTFSTDGDDDMTVVIDTVTVKIKPIVSGDSVKFDVNVGVGGNVSTIVGEEEFGEIRKRVIEEVEKEIRETYAEALKMDVDIYRFSEQLYRKELQTWKRIHHDGKIPLSEDSIRSLNITVERLTSSRKSYRVTIDRE